MGPDFEHRINCRDGSGPVGEAGSGRAAEMVVVVRDGALILRTPAGEAAVFDDRELLEQASVLCRVITLGVAQIRQEQAEQQRRGGR